MTREERTVFVRNWLASADYDLTTAEHMLGTGRYLYIAFVCRRAVEKMLNAHIAIIRIASLLQAGIFESFSSKRRWIRRKSFYKFSAN